MNEKVNSRVETEDEVKTYLQNLRYALESGANVRFQMYRKVDDKRNTKYTNRFAVRMLFPNKNVMDALKNELMSLTVANYMRTVKDLRFPERSEMREFGKIYSDKGDVYIKIRVELLGQYGSTTVFVMSFHLSDVRFESEMFPYA